MRNVLHIDAAIDHPSVILDKINNKFIIEGKSLPEDVNFFFDPIISWLRDYASNPNPMTEFTFNLEYFNSASVRKIVDILVVLENIYKSGKEVKVIWMYEATDEMMEENGEDFQHTVNIPFKIISYDGDE